MKVGILFLTAIQLYTNLFAADSVVINSPNKKIQVTVHYKTRLSYTIKYQGELILQPSFIDLILNNGSALSGNLRLIKRSVAAFNEKIISPVPEKRKEIADNYNLLTLQFARPYT